MTIETPIRRSPEYTDLFEQAQGLIVELTGCVPGRATGALLSVASRLSIDAERVAGRFVGCMNGSNDAGSETLFTEVIAAVLEGTTHNLVTESRIGDMLGIKVRGELCMATVGALLAVAAEVGQRARSTSGGTAVLFLTDLESVTFIDSAGLHALGDICAQVRGRDEQLLVTTPTARTARRVLELAVHRDWLPAIFAP
jgi:anti-anti-sigma factor